jgi:hypothetical protein
VAEPPRDAERGRERGRERERERERPRPPAGGDGARQPKDNESQK